jgi:(2Fe-2S) ferredoxin
VSDGTNLILVCTKGKHCKRRDGKDVFRALKKRISKYKLDDYYKVEKAECLGYCKMGPIVSIPEAEITYCHVRPSDCRTIFKRYLRARKPIKRLILDKKVLAY